MATQKFSYTIKHPKDIAITYFSINYQAHKKKQLDSNKKAGENGYTLEGDIEITSNRNSATVRIEAVGEPHLTFSYNVKFGGKALFASDVELTTNTEGVLVDTRKDVTLP